MIEFDLIAGGACGLIIGAIAAVVIQDAMAVRKRRRDEEWERGRQLRERVFDLESAVRRLESVRPPS